MISVIPVHPLKAIDSILVTEFGMVTDAKLVQFKKAFDPILVTVVGKVTDVKPVQF